MSEPILQGMRNPTAQTARSIEQIQAKRYLDAVTGLRKAVDEDRDRDAQYLLGWCYATGNGVPRSLLQAEQAFFGAATRSQPAAQYSLGRLRIDTAQPGNSKRVLSGVDSLKAAAEQGMAAAMRILGTLYRSGIPGAFEADVDEALSWFRKAGEAGDAEGIYLQGVLLEGSELGTPDAAAALALFNQAAANGSASAMLRLGEMAMQQATPDRATAIGWYEKAAGANAAEARFRLALLQQKADPAKAFELFRIAGQEGHAKSQAMLGMAFEEGIGTDKDMSSAFKWYRESALNGDASGMFHVAKCYEGGLGVAMDQLKASENYQRAGEAGSAEAQHMMGQRYLAGMASPRDPIAAAAWFALGAGQGHAPSMCDLGQIHETSEGTLRDPEQALALYRRAAALQYPEAWHRLGRMHEQGTGVPVDLDAAYLFYSGAARKGYAGAEDPAASVARRLPPDRVKALEARLAAAPDKVPDAF